MYQTTWNDTRAGLADGWLRVGNGRIERVWDLRADAPRAESVIDRRRNREWAADAPFHGVWRRSDLALSGCPEVSFSAAVREGRAESHLEVKVELAYARARLTWIHRVWPDFPVVLSEVRVRGGRGGESLPPEVFHDSGFRHVYPVDDRLDYFGLAPRHMRYHLTRFVAQSDYCDNLVQEEQGRTYPKEDLRFKGHLLHLRDIEHQGGLAAIKIGPPWKEQLQYPGHDFVCSGQTLAVTGWGLTAEEMQSGEEFEAYGTALGVTDGSVEAAVDLFYRLDRLRHPPRPERDFGVLSNTWGDGNGSRRLSEAMFLRELRTAARLGVTRCQLDAGWQQGRFADLGVEENRPKGPYGIDPQFWAVNRRKFPRGFEPVTARARALGIRLGFWFNPSAPGDYADWEKDADTVAALCNTHGFDAVKIDGVSILSKRGENRYLQFIERVHAQTGGRVCVHFDITGGRSWRLGHFYKTEHCGALFIENRYARDGSYFPFRTLRTLWLLARYIPSYRLQMEFVNTRRLREHHAGDDLAPDTFGTEYSCACVLFSNPLCWMEMQHLEPRDQRNVRKLLRAYVPHQEALLCGRVYPIGEEPSGRSWSGFQSVTGEGDGYLIVFREATDRPRGEFVLRDLEGYRSLALEPLAGASKIRSLRLRPDGEVHVRLSQPRRYAFFRYRGVR